MRATVAMSHQTTARLAEGGRVVLPAQFRRELNLHVGQEVLLVLEDGVIVVMNPAKARRKAQELVLSRSRDPKRSLADELLAERRKEAAHD